MKPLVDVTEHELMGLEDFQGMFVQESRRALDPRLSFAQNIPAILPRRETEKHERQENRYDDESKRCPGPIRASGSGLAALPSAGRLRGHLACSRIVLIPRQIAVVGSRKSNRFAVGASCGCRGKRALDTTKVTWVLRPAVPGKSVTIHGERLHAT
jgi:hypothetical protein